MRNDLSNDAIIWVVVKLEENEYDNLEPVVEEMGFSDKTYADKRAKHIRDNDGVMVWVYPVKAVWAIPPPVPQGAWTTSQGRELIAYHVPGRDAQPRLSQIVSDVWLSWRQQQANMGNLDEAGREQPSTQQLEVLYQEQIPSKPAQLELPFPAHT